MSKQCSARAACRAGSGGEWLKPGRACSDDGFVFHRGRWLCYPHAKQAGWRAPESERGQAVVHTADYWEQRYAEHIARVAERIRHVCGKSVLL